MESESSSSSFHVTESESFIVKQEYISEEENEPIKEVKQEQVQVFYEPVLIESMQKDLKKKKTQEKPQISSQDTYLAFYHARYQKLKKKLPELKNNEITKMIAKQWRERKAILKGPPSEYTRFYLKRYKLLSEQDKDLKATEITRIIVKEWHAKKKKKN